MCETVKRLASRIRKNSAQSALQWGHFLNKHNNDSEN